jgi:RND family efflux transporter MFP subunit
MYSKIISIALLTFLLASCSEDLQFSGMNAIQKLEYLEAQFENLDTTKKESYKSYIIQTKNDIVALDAKLTELKKKLGEEKKLEPVEVTTLEKTNFKRFVSIQSLVESDRNSMVSPKMSGVVTKINVDEGDYVKQGQVLIELDNSIQLRRLAQAENSLSFIETIYEKQKRVWEKKVGSEIDYLKAKNDYENMLENIKLIEEEIDMLKVKAPFSGTVDQVMPKVGEALSPGFGAVRLVSNEGLQIKVDFAENYLTNFKKGDPVQVYFPDLDQDTINLKISSISRSIDSKKRTVSAFIDIPSKYKGVQPNMTCITKFNDYSKDSTIVIPLNLVQKGQDNKYVFLADKNNEGKDIAVRKEIKTGEAYRDLIVVTGGLNVGDLLITTGESTVQNGKEIEIINN